MIQLLRRKLEEVILFISYDGFHVRRILNYQELKNLSASGTIDFTKEPSIFQTGETDNSISSEYLDRAYVAKLARGTVLTEFPLIPVGNHSYECVR